MFKGLGHAFVRATRKIRTPTPLASPAEAEEVFLQTIPIARHRTQEGLAVLAELITGSIDITRLRRVTLRVLAVNTAPDGADFMDLFRFFLDAGQSEVESVHSAQRTFRGGACSGKEDFAAVPSV